MEYVTLGRSGVVVSRLCLGTMTFGREADEAASCGDGRSLPGRRRDVRRHRRHLRVGRVRGDHGARSCRAPRSRSSSRRRSAGRWGRGATTSASRGATSSPRATRRCGASHGLDRPLPAAHVGRADADRGDALGADGPRPRGQGPLRRRLELRRLAAVQRGACRDAARLRAARVAAAAVLAHRARPRVRDRARGRGARHRADPVGAAGAGDADGQVRPLGRGPGVRYADRRGRRARGRDVGAPRRRAQLAHRRRGAGGRRGGGPHAVAGRAELAAHPAGRGRADRRRAARRAARGQPRRGRLAPVAEQVARLDDVSAPPAVHPYDFIAEGQREL